MKAVHTDTAMHAFSVLLPLNCCSMLNHCLLFSSSKLWTLHFMKTYLLTPRNDPGDTSDSISQLNLIVLASMKEQHITQPSQ